MSLPADPDPFAVVLDEGDAFCRGDEFVDWSRVEELPARMERVRGVDTALEFYDELAGHTEPRGG